MTSDLNSSLDAGGIHLSPLHLVVGEHGGVENDIYAAGIKEIHVIVVTCVISTDMIRQSIDYRRRLDVPDALADV
jgi:hypothetical protein